MNLRLKNILPECYVDTNVVQTLLKQKGANHQKSCSMVLKIIREKFTDQFAVGIIDSDKKEPKSLNDYTELIASNEELTLLKNPKADHYILQVNHVMENFLLVCANEVGYDMSIIGIENSLKGLKTVTKKRDSQENPLITKLVKSLQDSMNMDIMKNVLNYLINHPYDADKAELKKMFEQ